MLLVNSFFNSHTYNPVFCLAVSGTEITKCESCLWKVIWAPPPPIKDHNFFNYVGELALRPWSLIFKLHETGQTAN